MTEFHHFKLDDLYKYAKNYNLTVYQKGKNVRKTRQQLIDELENVQQKASGDDIKSTKEKYSGMKMEALKTHAKDKGYHGYSKLRKEELINFIVAHEISKKEGEEVEVDAPTNETPLTKEYKGVNQFGVSITKLKAQDVPWDYDKIIDTIHQMYRELKTNSKQHLDQEFYFQITGILKTSLYKEKELVSTRDDFIMLPSSSLVFNKNLKKYVHKWLDEVLRQLENITSKSGDYVEINTIEELTMVATGIQSSGGGDVSLKTEDVYLTNNVYCPEVQEDCLTYCLDQAGLTRSVPVAMIKFQENLTGYIKASNITKVLKYYDPCTVILHTYQHDEEAFRVSSGRCLRYCTKQGGPDIHLGLIHSHFILGKDPMVFRLLKEHHFELNDELNRTMDINTKEPVKQADLKIELQDEPKTWMQNVCFYDLETYQDIKYIEKMKGKKKVEVKVGDHIVYNVGVLLLFHDTYKQMRWKHSNANKVTTEDDREEKGWVAGKIKRFPEEVSDEDIDQEKLGAELYNRTKTFYGEAVAHLLRD